MEYRASSSSGPYSIGLFLERNAAPQQLCTPQTSIRPGRGLKFLEKLRQGGLIVRRIASGLQMSHRYFRGLPYKSSGSQPKISQWTELHGSSRRPSRRPSSDRALSSQLTTTGSSRITRLPSTSPVMKIGSSRCNLLPSSHAPPSPLEERAAIQNTLSVAFWLKAT